MSSQVAQNKDDERIHRIHEVLQKYAQKNFSVRLPETKGGDEIAEIMNSLNQVGNQMQQMQDSFTKFRERTQTLMQTLLEYTLMDFSRKLEISDEGDELDAIAVGLNTLAEELVAAKGKEHRHISDLEGKTEEILILNQKLSNQMEQLEVANKELEAFTYSVSHDLRAPLRAIHSYTNILSEDYGKNFDTEGSQMMQAVIRNAKKMSQLIDDLLAFSKAGKKDMIAAEIDMTKLAMDAVEEVKNNLSAQHADIKVHALSPAFADKNLIMLVFYNLISNAVKYSSKKQHPEIVVGQIKEKNQITYYVKDNGVGFDMQYYNKLFGVFNRLHSNDEFEGTGVGLALVKRIILRHGGKIWAQSTPGQGAIFYFIINTANNIKPV